MSEIWKKCSINDFIEIKEADLQTGPFGTQLHASDYIVEGTPVINVRNIGYGIIKEEKLEYISKKTVRRLEKNILKPGDIVFGRKGAVDRHVFIKNEQNNWFQGSDCLRLRINSPSIENRFLSYYFLTENHKKWMFAQCSHGATMPSLNQDILKRIPLFLPQIFTQHKIAAILSAYDDLIENNTRRIKILEEMAQAIYRDWFVHFRFPGYEGVRMVESELGLIPVGWEVRKLGEVIELLYGKGLKTEKRNEGNIPVFGSSGIVGYHNQAMIIGPGIIVGRKGNVGSVFWSDIDFFPIDTVYYVKSKLPLHYIFYNLKQQNFINNDAAVPGLNRNQAYSLPFLIPDSQTMEKFENILNHFFLFIKLISEKNANLRRTRDSLLPKLMSGDIDVSELDIQICEAEV